MLNWEISRLAASFHIFSIQLASCLDNLPLNCLLDPDVTRKWGGGSHGKIVVKLGKTVAPAVLCNEITMHGLQWLFISKLNSACVRLRERENEYMRMSMKGKREMQRGNREL